MYVNNKKMDIVTDNRLKTFIAPQYIEDLYYDMGGKAETTLSYDMIHELKSSLEVYLSYWLPRKRCCIRESFEVVFAELFGVGSDEEFMSN